MSSISCDILKTLVISSDIACLVTYLDILGISLYLVCKLISGEVLACQEDLNLQGHVDDE